MSGSDVARIGAVNNASLANLFFPGAQLGTLEPGAYADLIFVDYHPPTPLTPGNLPWHVIFGFDESMITTTIVSGKVLMHDRQVFTMDEEAVFANARALSPDVWKRYQEFVPSFPGV